MSLDVHLTETRPTEVFSRNITHNLAPMARQAGIYDALWDPAEIGAKTARDLIVPLLKGLRELEARPDHYRLWNPENGWGDYEGLVDFAREYLAACEANPNAEVSVCR